MPRSQGTSRKGRPGKLDKASGLGRSLLAVSQRYRPRSDGKNVAGDGGMSRTPGVQSIGAITGHGYGGVGGDNEEADTAQPQQNHPRSVLELHDLDDFLAQADLAERAFASERREALVVLDSSARAYSGAAPPSVRWALDDGDGDDRHGGGGTTAQAANSRIVAPNATVAFTFTELSVPRRPPWDAATTKDELERQEKAAFLEWRRGIAAQEARLANYSNTTSSTSSTSTPFEKNLEVWRQLWRVVERSACLLLLADARNPLFYLSRDLLDYCATLPTTTATATATTESGGGGGGGGGGHDGDGDDANSGGRTTGHRGKPVLILVNKSDYLTAAQRREWRDYLARSGWGTAVFFSAALEQQALDAAAADARRHSRDSDGDGAHGTSASTSEAPDPQPHQQGLSRIEDDEDDDDDVDEDGAEESDASEDHSESNDATDLAFNGLQLDQESAGRENTNRDIDDNATSESRISDGGDTDVNKDADDTPPLLTRQELIDTMLAFAAKHDCAPDRRFDNRIQFGLVGFPNVGKSSVINVLVGSSKHSHGVVRVAVASQPGKTKHFQTLLLPDCDEMMLCDCPGLVFPSFVSNTADLIAAGVYPIAQMRDHWPVTELICQRIPRAILNAQYGIHLPTLGPHELRERGLHEMPPPTAEEFLTTYCVARGLLASFSGVPDFSRAARLVIKDYADGKLLYCHPPPGADVEEFSAETIVTALQQTKRLREKLVKQQAADQVKQDERMKRVAKQQATNAGVDAIDEDLLLLIGAAAPEAVKQQPTAGQKKKSGQTAKWGKKDRKNRNKDPYGCHATPDGSLYEVVAAAAAVANGVTVMAGKHSQAGYTRPTTFAGRVGSNTSVR